MNYLWLIPVAVLLPSAFVLAAYLLALRRMPDDREVRARKRWKVVSRANSIHLICVIGGLVTIALGAGFLGALAKILISYLFVIVTFVPFMIVLGLVDRRVRGIDFDLGGYIRFQLFFFFSRWLSLFVALALLYYPLGFVGPDGAILWVSIGVMIGGIALFVLASLYQMRLVGYVTGALVWAGDEEAIAQDVSALARKAGIDGVKTLIMETFGYPFLNAFAAPGRIVYITRPLINVLGREEVSAVAAHEIGHLKTIKSRTFFFLSLYALFVVAIWVVVPRVAFILAGIDTFIVPILVTIVFFFLLLMGIQALSRRYEKTADLVSAELMGGPEPIIAALEKIYDLNMLPRRFDKKGSEKASHPSLERRVAELRGERIPPPKGRKARIIVIVILVFLIVFLLYLIRRTERIGVGVAPRDVGADASASLERRFIEYPGEPSRTWREWTGSFPERNGNAPRPTTGFYFSVQLDAQRRAGR